MIAQALSLAYAAGLSPYVTIALVGLASRMGWADTLPGSLHALGQPVDRRHRSHTRRRRVSRNAHSVGRIRLGHGAHPDPAYPALIAVVGLLGGTLGLSTHLTKLGLGVAIDSSPEPVTNGAMNVAEVGVIASLTYFVWHHPVATLTIALILLVTMIFAVHAIWRAIQRFLSGGWRESGIRS